MSDSAALQMTDEQEKEFRAQQRARREAVTLKFSRFLMLAGFVTGAGEVFLSYLSHIPLVLGLLTLFAGATGAVYPTLVRRKLDSFGIVFFFFGMLVACLGNVLVNQTLYSGILGFLAIAVIGAQWLDGRPGNWFMVTCVLLLTGSLIMVKVRDITDFGQILLVAVPEGFVSLIIGGTTIYFVYRLAAEQQNHLRQSSLAQWETERWATAEQHQRERLAAQMWLAIGQSQLNQAMRGEQDIDSLGQHIIQFLCQYLNAQVGTMYVVKDGLLKLAGSYAHADSGLPLQFRLGEGLVGQAALERRTLSLNDIPAGYLTISSSLGQTPPRQLLITPILYDDQAVGVIELGAVAEFSQAQAEFLPPALESIAIAFVTAQARMRVNELLTETQQQADELQAQEEELRVANEELETQTKSLLVSEAKLRDQAAALQQKSSDLQIASRYKSEFLARMSHELRTPLNSMLILSGMLEKNEAGNFTPDQVESMQVIHGAGTDLLNLINEILDLAKVEAGKMEFHLAVTAVNEMAAAMHTQFAHVAEERALQFEVSIAADAPTTITTDRQRVEQIIRNLLSNAFKFTTSGSVRLDFARPATPANGLDPARAIAIRVTDTGTGLTPEQQQIIFEAFQQVNGSTSRQYGGTGLGLAIAREIALRMGGHIDVASDYGHGSTFTLYLPADNKLSVTPTDGPHDANPAADPTALLPVVPVRSTRWPAAGDDDPLRSSNRNLLIIEDDPRFAKIVCDYARTKSFRCFVASDGEAGLRLVQAHPIDAIVLDLNLPGQSGWEVLDALKKNPNTRHIPVHILSVNEATQDSVKRGAIGFLTKPAKAEDLRQVFQQFETFFAHQVKTLLIVEDDERERVSVRQLLTGNDVVIHEAETGRAALQQISTQHFDCVILDLMLPDMSSFELLNYWNADPEIAKCPVVVYTGRDLTPAEHDELLKYTDSIILKGGKSPDRLLDETALFLHRVIAELPEDKQRTIQRLHDPDHILIDKVVLVVDDDVRNAFALSKVLTAKGIKAQVASSGQKALELLNQTPFDLVLMDIMMPKLDGYETTRLIRAQEQFRGLPILALTAKAMPGDREKCIEAGTNDYLTKPIDTDRLFSMLRVWLSK